MVQKTISVGPGNTEESAKLVNFAISFGLECAVTGNIEDLGKFFVALGQRLQAVAQASNHVLTVVLRLEGLRAKPG